MLDNNTNAFLALARAGLWEKEIRLLPYGNIDYKEVYRLAQEQAIVGLVAAGLEYVVDTRIPQEVALTFVGEALQLEQRNTAMDRFIGIVVEEMRESDISSVLVKGQGIAQSYLRPLWRACGDIDFFLNGLDYERAKEFLIPISSSKTEENNERKHLAMTIEPWVVELHGSMRSGLWKSIDTVIDEAHRAVFYEGSIRFWDNHGILVYLPRADEDIIFVFTHILQHFFQEGIGLRQICDWCRLLWTYNDSINKDLLLYRIKQAGILTEWKTFAHLAVNILGMPKESMSFYSENKKWKRKANKVLRFILKTGNFGHNRDYGYFNKYPFVIQKTISLWKHTKDCVMYSTIFPKDSFMIWLHMIKRGFKDL